MVVAPSRRAVHVRCTMYSRASPSAEIVRNPEASSLKVCQSSKEREGKSPCVEPRRACESSPAQHQHVMLAKPVPLTVESNRRLRSPSPSRRERETGQAAATAYNNTAYGSLLHTSCPGWRLFQASTTPGLSEGMQTLPKREPHHPPAAELQLLAPRRRAARMVRRPRESDSLWGNGLS